jgi:AraC family transcriptional regulator
VELPPLRDYAVVAYRHGLTTMRRRVDRRWSTKAVGPGAVSLLTRGVSSHWRWSDDIEVVHVYLTTDELTTVSREMFGREIEDVELHDSLDIENPDIYRTAMSFAREAGTCAAGNELLVSSLACQLSVQVLRRHAQLRFTDDALAARLGPRELSRVRDYASSHLHEPITLDDLAREVSLSKHHFARRFREAMSCSPYEYVLALRVERAADLIKHTRLPLADIARRCGFADQSHLTRHFRQRKGVTPGRFRADTST